MAVGKLSACERCQSRQGGFDGSHHGVEKDERDALWQAYKADQSRQELRNRLVEIYLPLVRYNGERIWRDCRMVSS